jgi:xanthine dehydrogenase YagT iron-sulfur-binding subunit
LRVDTGPDRAPRHAARNDELPHGDTPRLSRRDFLQTATAMAAWGALPAAAGCATAETPSQNAGGAAAAANRVSLTINGAPQTCEVDPRVTLLDLLREHLKLTGTKKGCDRGQCGACTVLANGRRINACLALALSHDGEDIVTIEGLARAGGPLHPMQRAFVEHDAFQCGYCTPGQICSAVALLDELQRGDASAATPDVRAKRVAPTDAELRERMSGNLCRCGAYPNIIAAIRAVAGGKEESA